MADEVKMVRLQDEVTKSVVNVDEATAGLLPASWKPLAASKAPAKPAPTATAEKK